MNQDLLQIDGIRVGYRTAGGHNMVVDGLSLALQAGEIGCLLGASGCGKTTVLRAIAGFESLQAGRILLQGATLSDADAIVAPEHRGIGVMFQDYALFPHLDVAGNVGFGIGRASAKERAARVAEMLALVGLPDVGGAYPHELSGGQQQRVALARALAPAPRLLLLDEPFSSLDAETRGRLAVELRTILKSAGITALLVTHDQAEAFAIADAIGVMHGGRILQWADARTLYLQPADRIVAETIGRGSLVPAVAVGLDGAGEVLVRPHQLRLDDAGAIPATVRGVEFRGPCVSVRAQLDDGSEVEFEATDDPALAPGVAIRLELRADPIRIPAQTR